MNWRHWFTRWPIGGQVTVAQKRRGAPRRRMYAGARQSNLEADWLAPAMSTNAEIRAAIRTLRNRSRQLARDNPFMVTFLKLLKTNVVGRRGIRLQSRIVDNKGKPRGVINGSIEVGWKGWGRKGLCTADGRMTWIEFQGMAITLEAMDGEYFVHHRTGMGAQFKYAVTFIDPDLLDEKYNQNYTPARYGRPMVPRIEMSVELDTDDRAVAYHFLSGHPSDIGGDKGRQRIKADEIEHGFIVERPGQVRGVPWAAPVMLALNMFDKYAEAELVASRAGAAKSVMYEQDPESVDANDDWDAELVDEVVPGTTSLLPPGIKAHQLDPQHPNSAFEPFQKAILRSVASALGASYSALTGDLRDVNFSSIRTGLLQERDVWQTLQRHLIDHLCEPVFRRWLRMASLADAIEVPGPETEQWADQMVWQPRGWAWVDPLKDVQAAEAGIALGTTTRSAVCAALGVDFEENLDQLKREQEQSAAAGVDVAGLAAGGVDGETDEAGTGASVSGSDNRGGAGGGGERLAAGDSDCVLVGKASRAV